MLSINVIYQFVTSRFLIFIVALLCVVGALLSGAHAQSRQFAKMLQQLKEQQIAQMRDYVAITRDVRGTNHPDYVDALYKYGNALLELARNKPAQPVLLEALQIGQRIYVGPNQKRLIPIYNRLIRALFQDGQYKVAQDHAERAVTLARNLNLEDKSDLTALLNALGLIHKNRGNFTAASKALGEAVQIGDARPGGPGPEFAIDLDNLSEVHRLAGLYDKSLPLKLRALKLIKGSTRRAHQIAHISVLGNLSTLYFDMGQSEKAETTQRESLALAERLTGIDSQFTANAQVALGQLYWETGRNSEAEKLFDEARRKLEKIYGPDHLNVGVAINNLAQVYERNNQFEKAEPLIQRAIAIFEKQLGPKHHYVATFLSNHGVILDGLGRHREAETQLRRAIAIEEETLGKDHPNTIAPLLNLGGNLIRRQRYAEARAVYQRAVKIGETRLGPNHQRTARAVARLARLDAVQKDWASAYTSATKAAAIVTRNLDQLSASLRFNAGDLKRTGIDDARRILEDKGRIAFRLAALQPDRKRTLIAESFEAAQYAIGTSAAQAITKMAARASSSSPELAALVRQRQDLVEIWKGADKNLAAAAYKPDAARNEQDENRHQTTIAKVSTQIANIDRQLTRQFPNYQSLTANKPAQISEVQQVLKPDEALILFQVMEKTGEFKGSTLAWVVTRKSASWREIDLDGSMLNNDVDALRCGLDYTAWYGEKALRCTKLLGLTLDQAPTAISDLPFNFDKAHALYQKLFAGFGEQLRGKHLLVVKTGALTRLPLHVLVTGAHHQNDPTKAAWMVYRHAITTLPTVSSIKSLRQLARPSAAKKAMVGFGNPLLDGDQEDPDYGDYFSQLADQARQNQQCSPSAPRRIAQQYRAHRAVAPIGLKSGIADPAHLRRQTPLPETADELCAVGRTLGADTDDIYLGERATEARFKRMSAAGKLSDFRIVHIATHGTLAGQVTGTTQPGLILTPPKTPNATDDGYLSAEEIAALRLDADWIILSACNTAAGVTKGSESLSGLARGFFYAGARALLVSHWEVDSAATVKLITFALGTISTDNKTGRAEALRRAMIALIKQKARSTSHPTYWAPFVVVGEGADI